MLRCSSPSCWLVWLLSTPSRGAVFLVPLVSASKIKAAPSTIIRGHCQASRIVIKSLHQPFRSLVILHARSPVALLFRKIAKAYLLVQTQPKANNLS